MAIYVVRHAKAGDRGEWEGDDRLRPLTKSGDRQAEALAAWLKKEPIDAVLSSGYLRCVQTLEPLAAQRKLPIEPRKDLEEGAGGDRGDGAWRRAASGSLLRLGTRQPGHVGRQ